MLGVCVWMQNNVLGNKKLVKGGIWIEMLPILASLFVLFLHYWMVVVTKYNSTTQLSEYSPPVFNLDYAMYRLLYIIGHKNFLLFPYW